MRRFSLIALTLLAASACRGDDDSGTHDGGGSGSGSGDAPPGGVVHVQDIQNDAMPPGTAVELHGVIVTAIDAYGTRTGDFWVEESGGGERSGVHVFGAPLSVVSTLQLGDVVDIKDAIKEEFALTSDTSGQTETELGPVTGGAMTVSKTGHGDVPAPNVVDALAIGQMTDFHDRIAAWEPWEGVLIKVNNVVASKAPQCVGSSCTDPTLQSFPVTGDIEVESAVAEFPDAIVAGSCFSSITGIESFFFNNLLYTRSDADFATGTSCPVENTHALCSDGMDNDGNGFVDCADFACQTADPACTTGATVMGVQMGTNTGSVQLNNVYVTATYTTTSNGVTRYGIYVADALQGAAYNGVVVYFNQTMPPVGTVVGAKVNVMGTVSEFGNAGTETMTELTNPTLTVVAAPGALPTPATTADAATLGTLGATGEPWEGVLVQLTNMKVTAQGTHNKVTLTSNAGQTITMDDDALFMYGGVIPPNGTCYATLTGMMDVQKDDQVRTINPRSAADMVIGTGCN